MIKILLFLGLSMVVLPTNAEQNSAISERDIIGEWQCKISYPDLDIQSIDQIDLQANGSSVTLGLLAVKEKFIYESRHVGNWVLRDNLLSETGRDFSFIRLHPKQTEKLLENQPQLKQAEQNFFSYYLNSRADGSVVDFRIVEFSPNQMKVEQIWENGQEHSGFCRKKANK